MSAVLYNIHINQFAVLSLGLQVDAIDMIVFNAIKYIINGPTTRKVTDENGETYYRVNYEMIISLLPIIKIGNKRAIQKRIMKLIDEGILDKYVEDNNRTYFKFGPKAHLLEGWDSETNLSMGYEPKVQGGIQNFDIGMNQKYKGYEPKVQGVGTNVQTIVYRENINKENIKGNPPSLSNDNDGSPTHASLQNFPYKEKNIEEERDSFLYGNSNDDSTSSQTNSFLYGKSNDSSLVLDNLITDNSQQVSSLSDNEETPKTLENKQNKKEKKPKATLEEALEKNPGYTKIISIFFRYLSSPYFQGDASAEKYGHYAKLFIEKLCTANNIPENQKHNVKDFFFYEAEKLVSNYLVKEQTLKSFDRALIGWANRSVQFNSFAKFKSQLQQEKQIEPNKEMPEYQMMQFINKMKN